MWRGAVRSNVVCVHRRKAFFLRAVSFSLHDRKATSCGAGWTLPIRNGRLPHEGIGRGRNRPECFCRDKEGGDYGSAFASTAYRCGGCCEERYFVLFEWRNTSVWKRFCFRFCDMLFPLIFFRVDIITSE